MQKISAQVTVMLLTFGFGVAFAAVYIYQISAKQQVISQIEVVKDEPIDAITTNQPTVNVGKNGTLEMVFVIDTTG
ncbi:MAG: hypothetical protein H7Z37_15945, partial [Pyrinomonadaceae bacterium]|nr:hypothetical protein [Pyrinomonadaceae bacterium]